MDYLPKDPAILVSSVNMLLREGRSPRDYRVSRGGEPEFDSLESLCYAFSREPKVTMFAPANAVKTVATAFKANKIDTKADLCAGKVFLAERPARNQ